MKNKLLAAIFAAVLTAFTVFVVLDTFVITRVYQTAVVAADMFSDNISQNDSASTDSPGISFTGNTDEIDTGSEAIYSEAADTDNSHRHSQNNGESPDHSRDSSHGVSSGRSRGSISNSSSDSKAPAQISSINQQTREYKDDNIQITLTQYTVNDTTVYAADIQLSSAEYLKSAFANNSFGRNITDKTSSIASDNNAVLAINGDYYGARERGYVIRNGVVYRDTTSDADILCIYRDGSVKIVKPAEATAQELVDQGVWQAYSFGPVLVENGEIAVTGDSEVGMSMASNPRTAIGIIDPLHYVFVVSDGRTSNSQGLSLYSLADFMKSLGVTTAYNLDGGGSSTMVFQGEVINNPTTTGATIKERGVSDIVYIG